MANFHEIVKQWVTIGFLKEMTKHYHLGQPEGEIVFFFGWQHATFAFRAGDNNYVVRFYRHRSHSRKQIIQEIEIVTFLRQRGLPVAVPLKDSRGIQVQRVKIKDMWLYVVLLPYLEGVMRNDLSHDQIINLGKLMVQFHQALADFDQEIVSKIWLAKKEIADARKRLHYLLTRPVWFFSDFVDRQMVWRHFESDFAAFSGLAESYSDILRPVGLIHGDLQQGNVKFTDGQISGLFDFSTIMKAPPVVDVAISAARIWMILPDGDTKPATISKLLTQGYGQIATITKKEEAVLPQLISLFLWKEMVWMLADPESEEQLEYHRTVLPRCFQGLSLMSQAANL